MRREAILILKIQSARLLRMIWEATDPDLKHELEMLRGENVAALSRLGYQSPFPAVYVPASRPITEFSKTRAKTRAAGGGQ